MSRIDRTDGVPVRVMCNPGKGNANIRHWFTEYGAPGSVQPKCQRLGCGAPNPAYRPTVPSRTVSDGLRFPGEAYGT